MGYIAPIFHSHYVHYHERMHRPVSEPLRVDSVEKKQKIVKQYKEFTHERQSPRSKTEYLGQVIDEQV